MHLVSYLTEPVVRLWSSHSPKVFSCLNLPPAWSPAVKTCFTGFLAIVLLLLSMWLQQRIRTFFQKRDLLRRIALKRERLRLKVDRMTRALTSNTSGDLITDERQTILDLNILDLAERLRSGALDPVDVLEAYQAKAIVSTQKTNCVVDFIEESREIAAGLREVPHDQRGPLFGIPISVKECHFVKGYDATAGLTKFMDKPLEKDSTIVQGVRELGGVPFCLTNVPQTMKTYGCSNPVYGVTTHPLDPKRTPGGSSGGEACLLAQGGSILGLGSDIGGSLRNPAHFCGIASLKPTSGRLYGKGRRPGGSGKVLCIPSVNGFMSPYVDGVILGMKSSLESSDRMAELDDHVHPIPWRKNLFECGKKLSIGWYDEDGYFPTTPGCKRAVHEAVQILQRLGHKVVPYTPPHITDFIYTYFDLMLADNGETTLDFIQGDILDQAIELNMLVIKTPFFIRKWVLRPFYYFISKKLSDLTARGDFKSADLWKRAAKLEKMIDETLEDWKEKELDAVICPGFVTAAPTLSFPGRAVPCISSCIPFNVADLPVGVLPVTRVNERDLDELQYYPRHTDYIHELAYQTSLDTLGLPLGIQIVGKPNCEETILAVMKIVEESRRENFP